MRNLFGAAAVILAALSAPIALTLTGTPALAQPGSDVTGWNVEVVQTAGGSFRKQPGGDWVELDASGRTAFNFQETGRDDWSVYLNDTSRDVQLQLDLHRRKVTYGTNGGAKSDLYDIIEVSGAIRPTQQPKANPPAQRPQNTSYPAPNQRIPVPTPTQRAPNNPYPPQNTSQSGARTRNVNAGPIWDQRDAELKCPVAAHAVNGRWTGGWRTTVTGKMSVCEIAN